MLESADNGTGVLSIISSFFVAHPALAIGLGIIGTIGVLWSLKKGYAGNLLPKENDQLPIPKEINEIKENLYDIQWADISLEKLEFYFFLGKTIKAQVNIIEMLHHSMGYFSATCAMAIFSHYFSKNLHWHAKWKTLHRQFKDVYVDFDKFPNWQDQKRDIMRSIVKLCDEYRNHNYSIEKKNEIFDELACKLTWLELVVNFKNTGRYFFCSPYFCDEVKVFEMIFEKGAGPELNHIFDKVITDILNADTYRPGTISEKHINFFHEYLDVKKSEGRAKL